MITFKPVVFAHQRRQDGTYNVKIRVTYNRKSRCLATNLTCTQADLTRSLNLKNGDLINKATQLCNQMRSVVQDLNLFDLEDRDVNWVVRFIRDALKQESFALDFFEFADRFLQGKTIESRKAYNSALNALARYLGKRSIDINDITHAMIVDFQATYNRSNKVFYNYVTGEFKEGQKPKVAHSAASTSIMMLNHIFQAAKNQYNDEDTGKILIPKSPFSNIRKEKSPSTGQRNLGEELMQRIIDYTTDDPTMRIALDAFILSFLLMGANLADLYSAPAFSGKEWVYNRQKTSSRRADHAVMHVRIPAEAEPYIERLSGRGGHWLPKLRSLSLMKDKCTTMVNRYLKRWCIQNDVPVFTFYAARHTWATLARKAGVEKATIDECLCHVGDFAIADIYAERNWELIAQANRKVLDMFKFKTI